MYRAAAGTHLFDRTAGHAIRAAQNHGEGAVRTLLRGPQFPRPKIVNSYELQFWSEGFGGSVFDRDRSLLVANLLQAACRGEATVLVPSRPIQMCAHGERSRPPLL